MNINYTALSFMSCCKHSCIIECGFHISLPYTEGSGDTRWILQLLVVTGELKHLLGSSISQRLKNRMTCYFACRVMLEENVFLLEYLIHQFRLWKFLYFLSESFLMGSFITTYCYKNKHIGLSFS